MALPVTHIALIKRVFDDYFGDKDRKELFIGTLFPDIRYLGVIDRTKTHALNPTIEDIKKLSSFEAGVKYHSLVDLIREKYMHDKGAYELIPESPYRGTALKIFEDKVLYPKVKDWNIVTRYFDSILDQEIAFGIEKKAVETWHKFLKDYMSQHPDNTVIKSYTLGIGGTEEMAEELLRLNEHIDTVPEIRKIVLEMFADFPSLL